MERRANSAVGTVNRRRIGVVVLIGLVLGALAVAAGVRGESPRPARAEDRSGFREVVLHLAFPDAPGAGVLTLTLFMIDDGSDLSERTEAGRAAMLARFPGAVELSDGEARAQFNISDNVRWPGLGASWSYNPEGATSALTAASAFSAITAGAEGWTNAGGSGWKYTYAGEATTAPGCNGELGAFPRDSRNIVGWGHIANGFWGYTCWWSGPQKVVGTNFSALQEFDIIFESSESVPYTPNVLRALALHEFGHALGLQHTEPARCPGHVMCGGAGATSLQTLSADDIAGAVALYGIAPTPTPTARPTVAPTATPPLFPNGAKERLFVGSVARD